MSKKLSLLVLILTMQTYCLAKEYVVYELIPLEYSQDYPGNYGYDLNNNGLVAGWANATHCENGRFPALYDLDGYNIIDIDDENGGMAWGINDYNQAVGYVSDSLLCNHPDANLIACIFYNDANGYIPLWDNGVAFAINNSGNITGFMKNASTGKNEPVFYGPETGFDAILLGSLPGYIEGKGQSINEQNIIVANYYDSNYTSQAVIIRPYDFEIIKLYDLGGGESGAVRINDNNQIIGYSCTENKKTHAVLYNTNNINYC
ncbi:MAG TPA: hypothetical protein PLP05_08020, partial [Sedimentisphaerales bacterium]|nr:hypothetical protein [Sedimentisphaerales bacterium]